MGGKEEERTTRINGVGSAESLEVRVDELILFQKRVQWRHVLQMPPTPKYVYTENFVLTINKRYLNNLMYFVKNLNQIYYF